MNNYTQSAIKFLTEKFYGARKRGNIDDVFINFISKDQSVTFMVNNIAGILLNVVYLKKREMEERRQRLERERLERQMHRGLLARSIAFKSTPNLKRMLAEQTASTDSPSSPSISGTSSSNSSSSTMSPSRKLTILAQKASKSSHRPPKNEDPSLASASQHDDRL